MATIAREHARFHNSGESSPDKVFKRDFGVDILAELHACAFRFGHLGTT
jgi:hypothetical protein